MKENEKVCFRYGYSFGIGSKEPKKLSNTSYIVIITQSELSIACVILNILMFFLLSKYIRSIPLKQKKMHRRKMIKQTNFNKELGKSDPAG